jgi:DNA-binding response OmpR family regulator
MAKILVVEDDPGLAFMVATCLEGARYFVDVAACGREAFDLLKVKEYDLLVLDLNLPDVGGLSICSHMRASGITTPILILTAKDSCADKVLALDTGADDFVTKPFHPGELLARLRALLRRPPEPDRKLRVGDIELDLETLRVRCNDNFAEISVKEGQVLALLLRNPERCFTTEAIAEHLWPNDKEASTDTVRSHIRNLRRKMNDTDGTMIRQVRGKGYTVSGDER